MRVEFLNENRAQTWFLIFICLHLLAWTLLPAAIRHNLPLDAIEGTTWGHQLEWGYDKNPFLNGWLTALAVHLCDASGWMLYLFSQVSVVLCFLCVWLLAKRILPIWYAFIGVVIMEGVQYFNLHAIDFNDNTLELGLWAATIYLFYRALQSSQARFWIATGLTAGLAMMAKYYTAALLASMFFFLIATPRERKHWRTAGPYLALLTFTATILPHVFWLFSHDFITVHYVFERVSSPPTWYNHFFFPLKFSIEQLQVFLPACLLLGFLLLGKQPRLTNTRTALNPFDKQLLLYMGLGPFCLTVLLAFVMGIKLRAGWGMPLLSLWGILLIAWLQPVLTPRKLKRFLACSLVLFVILLIGYTISLVRSPDESSANFPGTEIASTLTTIWHERYGTPLSYVAGSRRVGGNIGFYSQDKPSVYIEWDHKRAPWIDLQHLDEKGGIFIWSITGKEYMPAYVREQYPSLIDEQVVEFDWKRNYHHLSPIKLGIAFLPPKNFR